MGARIPPPENTVDDDTWTRILVAGVSSGEDWLASAAENEKKAGDN